MPYASLIYRVIFRKPVIPVIPAYIRAPCLGGMLNEFNVPNRTLGGKKDRQKTVASEEMQLPYLYIFCVTKFHDCGLHTIVRLMRFYKFILLHLKSKKKISFQ